MKKGRLHIMFISGEWDNYHRKGFYTSLKKRCPDDEFIIFQYPVSVILNLIFKPSKLLRFFRAFRKINTDSAGIKTYYPWIFTHSTFWIKFLPARIIDTFILSRQARRILKKHADGRKIVAWFYNPEYYFLLDKIKYDFFVYDFYDNYVYDMNNNADKRKEHYNGLNIRSADMVVATAKIMYDNAVAVNTNTFYITNASNAGYMTESREGVKREREKNTIVYAGAIKNWFDENLLLYTLKMLPQVKFVFLGYVERGSERFFKELCRFGNFRFLGMKPPEEVYQYLTGYSAGIIPFKITELTKGVMPIKFFDYVEAGLPVVCTELPELMNYREYIYSSAGREEFVRNCLLALDDADRKTDRYPEILKDNDWDSRAGVFYGNFENLFNKKFS